MAARLPVSRELVAHLIRRLRPRVEYADVRCEHLLHESLVAEDGRVSSISLFESAGVGVRVLRRGSWGFAATPHPTRAPPPPRPPPPPPPPAPRAPPRPGPRRRGGQPVAPPARAGGPGPRPPRLP